MEIHSLDECPQQLELVARWVWALEGQFRDRPRAGRAVVARWLSCVSIRAVAVARDAHVYTTLSGWYEARGFTCVERAADPSPRGAAARADRTLTGSEPRAEFAQACIRNAFGEDPVHGASSSSPRRTLGRRGWTAALALSWPSPAVRTIPGRPACPPRSTRTPEFRGMVEQAPLPLLMLSLAARVATPRRAPAASSVSTWSPERIASTAPGKQPCSCRPGCMTFRQGVVQRQVRQSLSGQSAGQ